MINFEVVTTKEEFESKIKIYSSLGILLDAYEDKAKNDFVLVTR